MHTQTTHFSLPASHFICSKFIFNWRQLCLPLLPPTLSSSDCLVWQFCSVKLICNIFLLVAAVLYCNRIRVSLSLSLSLSSSSLTSNVKRSFQEWRRRHTSGLPSPLPTLSLFSLSHTIYTHKAVCVPMGFTSQWSWWWWWWWRSKSLLRKMSCELKCMWKLKGSKVGLIGFYSFWYYAHFYYCYCNFIIWWNIYQIGRILSNVIVSIVSPAAATLPPLLYCPAGDHYLIWWRYF